MGARSADGDASRRLGIRSGADTKESNELLIFETESFVLLSNLNACSSFSGGRSSLKSGHFLRRKLKDDR